ncbi:outer membrane protein assembly factor BamE [Aliiglaciecola sp. CAU 1673]|uniref:outer membrane protein assembly factor BamE n=1 Tax=Aliiglaciecola sp. CAU 1673 TaxID=3032595 RepID=UPI0023DC5757|nr:outer membrane protein assembly factor BamE [Aliiglaciecola sp. CAU 1673]MDF2178104.1 outer membrane protein assembly factor BamE [Aliiglaciecola sp. CAU 1673]
MKYKKFAIALAALASLQACSSWIYRIDVPQGNYLEQKDVDKLRIAMTKEQVVYVLGQPVVNDAFSHDRWYYIYSLKKGLDGEKIRKELIIDFQDDRISQVTGDFELPENFHTPLDQ